MCTLIGVFAASYVAETVNFKIFVDGEEFKSEKPALAIDGSTYLPLKAVGEALGVPVVWNNEKKRVEVGEPPKDNYISYNNSNIPDFGIMYNIPYVEKVIDEPSNPNEETNVTYYYEWDEASEHALEYIKLLKTLGCKIQETSIPKGSDVLWHNCYWIYTEDESIGSFIAGTFTNYKQELKMYWAVSFNY